MRQERALRIGLTGPIGCGKSTVAAWLAEAGAAVIDADELAREVTEPGGPALDPIRERFGAGVMRPDGSLDRAALAVVVFSDPAALRDLEAIVHPEVRRLLVAEVDSAQLAGAALIVIEAIKLVEGGYARSCDEVWIMACDPGSQRQRLEGRGMAADDAERRIVAQGSGLAERLAAEAGRELSPARVRVIETDGDLRETHRAVLAALAAVGQGAGKTSGTGSP